MADFPKSTYVPRTVQNRTGITYDPSETKRLYAEDISLPADELVAVENYLRNMIVYKPDLCALGAFLGSAIPYYGPSFMISYPLNISSATTDWAVQYPDTAYGYPDVTKNPYWEFVLCFDWSNDFESAISCLGEVWSGYGFGFKVDQSHIYAGYGDLSHVAHFTSVGNTVKGAKYVFRIEFEDGVSIKYFINQTLVHTVDLTSVSVDTSLAFILGGYTKCVTLGSYAPQQQILQLLFVQEW